MLSNRLILIFLGVIFLIIIVLSSKRLTSGLQGKFAGIFPGVKAVPTVGMEPEAATTPTLTPSPTISHFTASKMATTGKTPPQTPATGAGTLSMALLATMAAVGIILKRPKFKED